MVHAAGRRPATVTVAGGHALRGRLPDQPLGHDPGRQARHRHHLDRLALRGRPERAADAVGLRRGRRRRARPDGRSPELARAAQLAHRRDARAGPRRGARGAAAAPQRVHHRDAAAPRRASLQDPRRSRGQDRVRPRRRRHDRVARITSVLEISGGFGTVVGFVHDWANPENTMRSWDMVARYVVPEINGYVSGLRKSREFVANNREYFNRAREAVMAKITENEAAAAALAVTKSPLLPASSTENTKGATV